MSIQNKGNSLEVYVGQKNDPGIKEGKAKSEKKLNLNPIEVSSLKQEIHRLQKINQDLKASNLRLANTKKELQSINQELEENIHSLRTALVGAEQAYLTRSFLAHAPFWVWIKNQEGRYVYSNSAINNLFQTSISKVQGNLDKDIFDLKIARLLEKHDKDIAVSQKPLQYSGHIRESKHGQKRYLKVVKFPLFLEDTYLVGGFCIDITEKQEEVRIIEAQFEQVQKNNNHLKEFAIMATHDLGAPARNINSLIGLLDKENLGSPQNIDLVGKLETCAIQLNENLQDFSDLVSLTELGAYTSEKVSIPLLVDSILKSIGSQVDEIDPKIELDFQCEFIEYPPVLLRSIMMNFITNSLKYRSPHRKLVIQLSVEQMGSFIRFRVQDNGLGIDMKKHGNDLFKMHKRFHNRIAGRGIGLYITKKQVEALGGRIEAESHVGKGSTFSVYLKC